MACEEGIRGGEARRGGDPAFSRRISSPASEIHITKDAFMQIPVMHMYCTCAHTHVSTGAYIGTCACTYVRTYASLHTQHHNALSHVHVCICVYRYICVQIHVGFMSNNLQVEQRKEEQENARTFAT